MLISQDLTKLGFHEATLSGVVHDGAMIRLLLDDVPTARGPRTMEVIIEGVSSVLRDGTPIDCLRKEMEDGEVLTLDEEDGNVVLAVEWNDFQGKQQQSAVYTLIGGKIGRVD